MMSFSTNKFELDYGKEIKRLRSFNVLLLLVGGISYSERGQSDKTCS